MRVFNRVSEDTLLDQKGTWLPANYPVVALYDVCNALPSIAHLWLFAVVNCIGLPKAYYTLIKNLYMCSYAYSTGIRTSGFLFHVLSQVRTGCPMSATLFLLAMNPFLDLIIRMCDGHNSCNVS